MTGRLFLYSATATILIVLAPPVDQVRGETQSLRTGVYAITYRLELPHLERWAVEQTKNVCISAQETSAELPIPILSPNNPFEKCRATNLATDSNDLQYDVVCPGRDAARAHAVYVLSPDAITGRVAMVMGAKNMTMTEVQHAKRVADCDRPTARPLSNPR